MTSSPYLPLLPKQWKKPTSQLTPLQAVYYVKSTFIPHANHYSLESPMLNSKNLQLLQIGPMLFNTVLPLIINGGTRTTRNHQNSRTTILLINLLGIHIRKNVVLPSLTDLVKSRRDRKSTRLNSSHRIASRMPSSA